MEVKCICCGNQLSEKELQYLHNKELEIGYYMKHYNVDRETAIEDLNSRG